MDVGHNARPVHLPHRIVLMGYAWVADNLGVMSEVQGAMPKAFQNEHLLSTIHSDIANYHFAAVNEIRRSFPSIDASLYLLGITILRLSAPNFFNRYLRHLSLRLDYPDESRATIVLG